VVGGGWWLVGWLAGWLVGWLAAGCWLAGCWLLVAGCWLLVAGYGSLASTQDYSGKQNQIFTLFFLDFCRILVRDIVHWIRIAERPNLPVFLRP